MAPTDTSPGPVTTSRVAAPSAPDAVGLALPRELTHEEATSPDLVVEVGERLLVDPADLQTGSNVRRDLQVSAALVETVRANGVLKDIDVYPSLTGLVILDGHRRHAAALRAGLKVVPVRVVSVASESERIGVQLLVNDTSAHTLRVERAETIQQLVLLGASAAELRGVGVSTGEVQAAKRIAKAPEAARKASARLPGLDMLSLARIADLSADMEDPGDLEEVVRQCAERPDQVDHVLTRAAADLLEKKVLAKARADLEAQGFTVRVDHPWADPKCKLLGDLKGADGVVLDEVNHRECPGHAAYIAVNYRAEQGEDVLVRWACQDWRAHGHLNRWAQNTSGATSGPMPEEAAKARTERIRRNRAHAMASEVRVKWVRDNLLPRSRVPADADLLTAPVLWVSRTAVSTVAEAKGLELLGVERDAHRFPATPSAARRSALTLACALMEGSIERDSWAKATETWLAVVRLYLRALEAWGYGLSDCERELCEASEAGAAPAYTIPKRTAGGDQ